MIIIGLTKDCRLFFKGGDWVNPKAYIFYLIGSLGWFSLRVAMCAPSDAIFRPIIGPEITWSVLRPPSHPPFPPSLSPSHHFFGNTKKSFGPLSQFFVDPPIGIWVKMPRINNRLFDVLNLLFLAGYCGQLWLCRELR